MQKLHLTQKVKICSYVVLSYEGSAAAAEFTGSEVLNQADYSIWNALQEKVYLSRIANVNELEMRLIDERARFDQSMIVDAAIGQWRRHLSVFVRGAVAPLYTKNKSSAILLSIYQKLLN